MDQRRPSRLAVAGAALAAGLAPAAPVVYDPETKLGFVGRAEVRDSFGWTDAMLASRAKDVVFKHRFWIEDTYSATCGPHVVPVSHYRQGGHLELTDTVTAAGFRLTGMRAGISGTSQPPAAGQPCPGVKGATIDEVRPVSSIAGWSLTVTFGQDERRLLGGEEPVPHQPPESIASASGAASA